jgi:hypothetical protein
MAGAKLRIVYREKSPIGFAVAGRFTYFDDLQDDALRTVSGIAGIGDTRRSLNVSLSGTFSGSSSETVISVGGDFQVGARTKILAEFGTTGGLLLEDEEFDGIMNIGFRFFGDRMSFTLTGFRPLGETGSLILFPLAVFSINR